MTKSTRYPLLRDNPLVSYELGFGPEGIIVRIHYTSAKELDTGAQEVLTRVLRTKLKADTLQLVLERDLPPGIRRAK